ncbi:MAG: TlpA disulfide reductase family protein [Candidatus Neomarinimicrobiota bacterium]|nr:TlpA disulfide reductase family protein [Candidatus Neomarinimicrobiota bacterium]
MKKYGFLLLIISVLFGQSTIPNTKVRLLNNQNVSLNELTNGVSIVSFWATWCIPCVKEIYAIEKLIQDNNYDISVVLINTDDAGKIPKVKSFVNSKKYLKGDNYHIVMDYDKKLYKRFNAKPIPLTFITDGSEIVYRKRGFVNGDEHIFKEELDKILDE